MSQIHVLHVAESIGNGINTWDSLDRALREDRVVSGSIDAHDSHGNTALHIAAKFGRTSTVRALVAAGASLNVRTSYGRSPLMMACREGHHNREGHHRCVAVLVAAGADVNMEFGYLNETALTLSAEAGCLRSVQILLGAGASVNAAPWTPLHAAIYGTGKARYECAVALLRAGANVNKLDHMLRSPLMLAAESVSKRPQQPRLIWTLLREGARLPDDDFLRRHALNKKIVEYITDVRQAGGIVRYEKMRRAPFITALTRCFPLPSDTIPLVVEFWVRRALEY